MLLLLCTAILLACGSVSPPQAVAADVNCIADQPEHEAGPPPRNVCIAGEPFRARGRIDPRCLKFTPIPGQRYPAANWCQKGTDRIEAIAHSRFISTLGLDPFGIEPEVQWEIQLGSNRDRADVTDDNEGDIDLYEVKRTANSSYAGTIGQLQGYQRQFNRRNVPTRLGGRDYFDYFLVGRPGVECELPGGRKVAANRVFFSWLVTEGVIAVWEAPFRCFDAERERVPRPVPEPFPVPVPVGKDEAPRETNVPVGRMGDSVLPQPVPNTTLTTFTALPAPVPGGPPASGGRPQGSTGVTRGDPHMTSLDGLGFGFQAAGEFQLIEAEGVNVQVRLAKQGSGASVVSRIAFELNEHVFEVDPFTASLRVDGEVVTLESGDMFDFGDGSSVVRSGGAYHATWPGEGIRPSLRTAGGFISYYVPPDLAPWGLLGDADGKTSNDFMLGDGTRLPVDSSESAIHGVFADSWRITDDESLFAYAPGQSTATFTDRSFPETVISLGDYPDEVLEEGTRHCTEAGVPDGRPFENCLLDWAVTRQQAFVEAAADDDVPSIEPGARKVGADGVVVETFDASVAPNFSAPRYGSGAGSGRFAGPFGRDGRYSASVPMLPGHKAATLQLDLVTLGSWPQDASNPVTITINGSTAWTGYVVSRTPTAQGTTPGGQPYAVYPLSVTVPHGADQLEIGVSARLPLGTSRAFAVDNVRASVDLVAPQSFDLSLPFAANTSVGPGAGRLETIGSEDRYRFTLDEEAVIQVDPRQCWSALAWTLVRAADGDTVAEGGCSSKRSPLLDAGAYELSFKSRGRTGSYDMPVARVPDPQRFDVALPTTVSDGAPAAGAGRLETTASQDDYEFSTQVTGGVIIDVGACSSQLGLVSWKLVDAGSGIAVASASGCSSRLVPNLKADDYRLEVTSNGRTGTYTLGLEMQPAPQKFAVELPAAIRDGAPAGAGSLETTASEDVYLFETRTGGGLVVDLFECSSSLSTVHWKLVNEAGATIRSETHTCGGTLVANLPAGKYELVVSRQGHRGTYELDLATAPAPQSFQVDLPAAIQDGSPAGAGNLETSASEDVYHLQTAAAGGLQVDVSNCSSSLGAVAWKLTDQTGLVVHASDSYYGTCSSILVADVPAGHYTLSVKRSGRVRRSGTYRLGLLSQPAAQTFEVVSPASISDGSPAPGAGNLETTASEDRYQFALDAEGSVQVNFSECAPSLGGHVSWELVRTSTNARVSAGTSGCATTTMSNVPAGTYQVRVTRNGRAGTYKLRLLAEPVQSFDVALPASIQDGSPPGSGNLETTASQDRYHFTTAATGALRLDFSDCSTSLGRVHWKLIDTTTGYTEYFSSGCSASTMRNLPAGKYRLVVTNNAATGTYKLAINSVPPQAFDISLPADVSDGQPTAGAGNLETTISEDRYLFTTSSAGALQLDFSDCSASLTAVRWTLKNQSGSTVASSTWSCGSRLVSDVPAGSYTLGVTAAAGRGTYKLRAFIAPPPQEFALPLPGSVSDGQPEAGAGNLESTASEDRYTFETTTTAALGVSLHDCASTLSTIRWVLTDLDDERTVSSGSGCAKRAPRELAAGRYRLAVLSSGQSGTYKLDVQSVAPQSFDVSLPAAIADGEPAAGAGNLETIASEDRYSLTTTQAGALEIEFSSCEDGLASIDWKLTDAETGDVVRDTAGCSEHHVPDVPAGRYRIDVAQEGATGTYELLARSIAAPQRFDVQLPASISDGQPSSGAGNIEAYGSEDHYTFETSDTIGLEVAFSQCAPNLETLSWRLVNAATDNVVSDWRRGCGLLAAFVRDLPGGKYRLDVRGDLGGTGIYQLALRAGDGKTTIEAGGATADVPVQTAEPLLVKDVNIAHAPQTTSFYGRPIPIEATADCKTVEGCSMSLLYRPTRVGDLAGWTRVPLTAGAATAANDRKLVPFKGTIPGTVVGTRGVDYVLEARDGDLAGRMPQVGVGPTSVLHVATISPPIVTHQPPPAAQPDRPVPVSLQTSCSTGNCHAEVFYRTSPGTLSQSLKADGIAVDPKWPSRQMQQSGSIELGDIGKELTFNAEIPASVVTTRGVDYYFRVTDGETTTYWPGTMYSGHVEPTDGQRVAFHHLHVLEPTKIVHQPPATAAYRKDIPIAATATCPLTRTCTAKLYWRTTTKDVVQTNVATDFQSAPMTVIRGVGVDNVGTVTATAKIPAKDVDTRGVDYFFSVTDGETTAWYPGTSHIDGYVAIEGTRVAWQHVRVLEPPHIITAPKPVTPALQPYEVTAKVSCSTPACAVKLHYTSDGALPAPPVGQQRDFKVLEMAPSDPISTDILGDLSIGTVREYKATIPAGEVTTRGIAYYISADDGHTSAYAPGLSYEGAYLPRTDASPTGPLYPTTSYWLGIDREDNILGYETHEADIAFPVRVLEPPHPVSTPPTDATRGEPVDIDVTSNCSSPTCDARLSWLGADDLWHQTTMTAQPPTAGIDLLAGTKTYRASIPGADTDSDIVYYNATVDDGYTTGEVPIAAFAPAPPQ